MTWRQVIAALGATGEIMDNGMRVARWPDDGGRVDFRVEGTDAAYYYMAWPEHARQGRLRQWVAAMLPWSLDAGIERYVVPMATTATTPAMRAALAAIGLDSMIAPTVLGGSILPGSAHHAYVVSRCGPAEIPGNLEREAGRT